MEIAVEGNLSPTASVETTKSSVDPMKRPTFAEKLMSVRNTQCEQYLARVQERINHYEHRNMQRIRDETNRVTYDLKDIKVVQMKRELELKKQQQPDTDTEQDEFDIYRAERYLVFNPNVCFYTNKKNQFPIRSQAKLDPYHVTPTVSQARKKLQDMANDRHIKSLQEKRALMSSRKSNYSVRFNSPTVEQNGIHRGNVAESPHKDTSGYKQCERSVSPSRRYNRTTSAKPRLKSPSTTQPIKGKSSTPHATATVEIEDIPDDFTQCMAPHQKTKRPTQTQDNIHLPSMTSQQRAQSYLNNDQNQDAAAPFGELEKELPPHELMLLQQGDNLQHPHICKSALVRRAPSQMSQFTQRRQTSASASAASMKKRQFTHAAMRKENKEVESKVQYFLRSFDKSKKRRYRYQAPVSRDSITDPQSKQVVSFQVPEDNVDGNLNMRRRSRSASPDKGMTEDDLINLQGVPARAKTAVAKSRQQPQYAGNRFSTNFGNSNTLGTESRDKSQTKPRTKGIPHHSQERSKRHTATYKLRKVVEELIKNRTKQQILEYEKMKNEGQIPESQNQDIL